jgi:AraC-like DNA-binding protein
MMIPVYSLDDVVHDGFFIGRHTENETARLIDKVAHRDDHYIFIIQEQGESVLMLDFIEMRLSGAALVCMLPGQVHRAIAAENTIAWFIAVQAAYISDPYRRTFGEQALLQQAISLDQPIAAILQQTLRLLLDAWDWYKSGRLNADVFRSLADAAFGIIAQQYDDDSKTVGTGMSRPMALSRSFKLLVAKHYKTSRAPSDYAKMLNISHNYLYEVMKGVTGFSPIYWIQQEVITEAKRLLFFTDLSVKEIAGQLGFDDHNYFSRVFTKVSGSSPLHFRQAFRE